MLVVCTLYAPSLLLLSCLICAVFLFAQMVSIYGFCFFTPSHPSTFKMFQLSLVCFAQKSLWTSFVFTVPCWWCILLVRQDSPVQNYGRESFFSFRYLTHSLAMFEQIRQ